MTDEKTAARRERRITARRAQILDAAAQVFAEKGFARATTKEIADAADVSEGTIYNYFGSKEDLVLAMMARVAEMQLMSSGFTFTDEQREQMRNLYVQFREKTREARMTGKSLIDEKKTMLMSGKIDQKKLAELDDAILKSRTEVGRERLKLRRERLALLTGDQVKILADFMARKQYCRAFGAFSGHRGKGRFARW